MFEVSPPQELVRKRPSPPGCGSRDFSEWQPWAAKWLGLSSHAIRYHRYKKRAPGHVYCFCLWYLARQAQKESPEETRRLRRERENARRRELRRTDLGYKRRTQIQNRESYRRQKGTEQLKARRKRYRKGKQERERRNTHERILRNVRVRTARVANFGEGVKPNSLSQAVGCSALFLRRWLERQFVGHMSWDNYGRAWQIDHVIPLSSFNLADPKQFGQACHYTNLKPVWRRTNMRKGDKVVNPQLNLLFNEHG